MPGPRSPVVVLGDDLAALAAALRLVKAGRRVTLVAETDRVGGRWAPPGPSGVDLSPSTLLFPAPWRDLFRKTGRPLEDELRRAGLVLSPAPPVHHLFPDGSSLDLPTGRAEQQQAIDRLVGPAAGRSWQTLLDGLDTVWQTLRFHGMETPLTGPGALDKPTRRALWADRALADLAAALPDPRLAALVADLAALDGSEAGRTPAFVATELAIRRTFGCWVVRPGNPTPTDDPAPRPLSALVGLLVARLELRGVDLRLGTRVEQVEIGRTGGARAAEPVVRAVRLSDGSELEAVAVVATGDLGRLYDDLLTGARARGLGSERRHRRRSGTPALVPALTAIAVPGSDPGSGDPVEEIRHRSDRPPRVRHRHPGGVVVSADHADVRPDPAGGVRWHGFDRWCDRPPTRSVLPGLFLAGPAARSGPGPHRQLLGAALAATAVLDGARVSDR